MITPYGNTFENAAIVKYLETSNECPLTRKVLSVEDLTPNRNLGDAIRAWTSQNKESIQMSLCKRSRSDAQNSGGGADPRGATAAAAADNEATIFDELWRMCPMCRALTKCLDLDECDNNVCADCCTESAPVERWTCDRHNVTPPRSQCPHCPNTIECEVLDACHNNCCESCCVRLAPTKNWTCARHKVKPLARKCQHCSRLLESSILDACNNDSCKDCCARLAPERRWSCDHHKVSPPPPPPPAKKPDKRPACEHCPRTASSSCRNHCCRLCCEQLAAMKRWSCSHHNVTPPGGRQNQRRCVVCCSQAAANGCRHQCCRHCCEGRGAMTYGWECKHHGVERNDDLIP